MGSKPLAMRFGFAFSTQARQMGSLTPFTRTEGTLFGLHVNILLQDMHGTIAKKALMEV